MCARIDAPERQRTVAQPPLSGIWGRIRQGPPGLGQRLVAARVIFVRARIDDEKDMLVRNTLYRRQHFVTLLRNTGVHDYHGLIP